MIQEASEELQKVAEENQHVMETLEVYNNHISRKSVLHFVVSGR